MKANLEIFESGWSSLSIGLKEKEIDALVKKLLEIRASGSHFHFRSGFEGVPGIGDIEVYLDASDSEGPLQLEELRPIYSHE